MTQKTSFTVMTYNILFGGQNRISDIETVIRAINPDILGIQEANDPQKLAGLADRLEMNYQIGLVKSGFHLAILTKFPIVSFQLFENPIFQKGLIEAVLDIPGEEQYWHIYVGHLTANFSQGYAAEKQREREVKEYIALMETAQTQKRPHILLGDFNALAPGEMFRVNKLIQAVTQFDKKRKAADAKMQGLPHLNYIIPPPLRPFSPLIRSLAHAKPLADAMNSTVNTLIPRKAARALLNADYIDCLAMYYGPKDVPPTCPNPLPAGRIDYIWADIHAALRVKQCKVITPKDIPETLSASDHLPVAAILAGKAAAIKYPEPPEQDMETQFGSAAAQQSSRP